MPIYEYHCLKCRKDHELIRKLNDKVAAKCPTCGKTMKKKMSLSGFQLKGGGWYKDGYSHAKPPAEKSAAPSEAPSAKATESPKETKESKTSGESKPVKKEKVTQAS